MSLFKLNEETLKDCGIKRGPASVILQLITVLRKAKGLEDPGKRNLDLAL